MLPAEFNGLLPSPATKHWGEKYPSIFKIDSDHKIVVAVRLLHTAYNMVGKKH